MLLVILTEKIGKSPDEQTFLEMTGKCQFLDNFLAD